MKFRHTTTDEAREDLKKKWYYQQCMDAKNSPAWKGRAAGGLPVSEACYMTAFDATRARKYTWNVEFVKVKINGLLKVSFGVVANCSQIQQHDKGSNIEIYDVVI